MISVASRFKLLVAMGLLVLLLISLAAGCNQSEEPEEPVEMATLQDLSGMSVEEAEQKLQEMGLEAGEKSEEFSDNVAAGIVISTTPSAGDELEKGSSVALVVSKGPETVAVPSIVGAAEADAVAILQSLGFQVEVWHNYNETVAAGLVMAVEPAVDTALMKGSKVIVTVSLGTSYTTCPTCGGSGQITTTYTCPECGGTGFCDT
jgi:beta-lactam-binding protein with PASTA domain